MFKVYPCLTIAIVGMHFTNMAAVSIWPVAGMRVSPALLSNTALAAAAIGALVLVIGLVFVGVLTAAASQSGDLRRLRQALDVMPEALAFYDAQDRLMAWNAPYEHAMRCGDPLTRGRPHADILRASITQGGYPEAAGREEEWIAQRMAARRQACGAQEMQMLDGRWLRLNDRRTPDGGTITVFEDITESKRAEAAVVQARDLAEAANRTRSQFLANMSHELRTPMNGIMVMNTLLLRTSLTPDQRRFAQTVQSSADALLTTLNDILDVSKLEAGKVELEIVAFSLDEVVKEVMTLMGPRAREKSLRLSQDLHHHVLSPLRGDAGRIRQVLLNLVTNAVKFTDAGAVAVVGRIRPGDGDRRVLRMEVHDTGIGLADEAKAKLFQNFQQADGSITRRFGGTGLGLSISRQLVQLMGGEIGVLDGSDGGSIFWFELPLPRSDQGERTVAA